MKPKNFYITTAIDYANGKPHLGHAYEKVLTDVVARFRRLKGDTVHFLTGLDEHGQKVQQTARKMGIEPQELCDEAAGDFQSLCRDLNISNNDYIRTTEERHKVVVRSLLQKLWDEGQIYEAEYEGFYSTRAEQFLQEKDKVNGAWPEEFGEVVEISEKNYFFRLSNYQDWLVEFLREREDFIFPRYRQKDVLEFLKEPINDLCISRPKERLEWGISLPFDEAYVTYVWFDALTNYISAVGYGEDRFAENWPVDFHVIGKDIMIPPHAVYWPIMLKACGIEPPKHLLVHGWWLKSGSKMAKSTGNIVNPLDLIEEFGADAFRYFVTREMNVGQDSDFSLDLFLRRYNSDLANDFGNLVSRALNMSQRYLKGVMPTEPVIKEEEKTLREDWETTCRETLKLFEGMQFHSGLERVFQFVRGLNRYAEQRTPWKRAKSEDPEDRALVETCLFHMVEGIRLSALLLSPVIPGTAEKVGNLLGENLVAQWGDDLSWSDRLAGREIGKPVILFPRPKPNEAP
ncbi:MAG: methionine--tRNA ligase [Opitutales bacterium]|nr:methionine--tRNA ligase [Opitutales bacterium]MCH8539747.1 methionine--tRNA ligase [Opitutales bacterium]